MAVFRVERTRDYTVMCNHHLKDSNLSLKAKGLLSMMLSLPDEWNYTTRGLATICKEGVDAIGKTLKELELAGYIIRRQLRGKDGRISDTEYTIFEKPRKPSPPDTTLPDTENPYLDNPDTTSGISRCAAMCGEAARASPLWIPAATNPNSDMYSMFPIPAAARTLAALIFGNTGRSIVRWYLRHWSSALTFPVKTDLQIRWSVWRRSL